MKLLIFAHTPPPHHGQSYMVQLMLEGFGGDARRRKPNPESGTANAHGIECYHVNARFSRGMSDIGEFQGTKMFLVLWYCLQAIWIRFRYGVKNFYYVPAPGKRVALYRDWLVMLLCRPFFEKIILHWHAAGMAKWLETENPIQFRALTWRLFRPVNLSLVISHYNIADGQKLLSRQIVVLNNGIPDPCEDFEKSLLPYRQERFQLIRRILNGENHPDPLNIQVAFLAHCTREKGLFAAVEAVRIANRRLKEHKLSMRLTLTVAGNFVTVEEREEFEKLRHEAELTDVLKYVGFVSGEDKSKLYREADIFCFPTHYLGENQPVNIIEAMAYGLPMVTTRWRSLPEMMPEKYSGLVSEQNPDKIASAMLEIITIPTSEVLREHFCSQFSLSSHLTQLSAALRNVDSSGI